MLQFFMICFMVGVILSVVSFIFGHVFEIFGVDGLDIDLDFLGVGIFLPLSPALFFLFLTVFGGLGSILMKSMHQLPALLALVISMVIGMLAVIIVYKGIMKPLKKAQNTSAPEIDDLIGLKAIVTETILPDAFGEISYTINGNTYSAPAKATTKEVIKASNKVAICWIKDHVFYVASIDI